MSLDSSLFFFKEVLEKCINMHNINPTPQVTESLQFACVLGVVVKDGRGGG